MSLLTSDSIPVAPAETSPAASAPSSDDVSAFRHAVLDKLTYMVGKDPGHAQEHDWLVATALAVRDRVVDRWMDATRRTYRDGRKRVYYFSLEFLIGRLLFDALGNLGLTDDRARGAARARRRSRPAAQARARRRARQRRPGPARGVLHGEHGDAGDPRPRLRHPLRPRNLPAGVEGRLAARAPRGLAVVRQPVGVRAAGGHLHGELRRHRRHPAGRGRRDALGVGAGRERQCGGVRHPAHRLARTARQYAAAVVGARDGPVAAGRLQSRRPRRGARRPRPAGSDLAGALPQRRNGGRPRAAPAAGVLLRVRVAAGPAAPAQGAARRARIARRPRVDPVERHAPGHRSARADAAADRRPQHALGAGVEHHDVGVQLHEPHAAAGGAGDLAGVADGEPASAAHADRLSHQRAASRRPAFDGTRDRRRLPVVDLADRGEPQPADPDGSPRVPRVAPRQRRVGAAHGPDAADGVPQSARDPSGAHRQQDQRHHVPPLAVPGEPGADRAHRRRHRTAGPGRRQRARGAGAVRRRSVVPRALPRGAAQQQGGAGAARCRAPQRSASIRRRCSTCRSSASTSTSGSC